MRKAIFRLPLGALILLLLSCPTSTQSNNGGGSGGSLVINLPLTGMQDPKRPDPDVVLSYDVRGAGPGTASFQELGITATSVTINSLVPGDWGVTVAGNNYLNAAIASTSMPVTIVEGKAAATEVAKSQLVSSGTLALSLKWNASSDSSSVVVSLTPQGGVPYTLPALVADSGGISSVNASVPVPIGYYTLSRVYMDGSSKVTWGAADTLRITSGSTTKLDLSAGVVTITPDISKVIAIGFTGQKNNFGKGEVVAITATPTPPPSLKVSSFSYQWYVNGKLQLETSPTINFGQSLPSGSYRLDVVVSAQNTLSSDNIQFSVSGN